MDFDVQHIASLAKLAVPKEEELVFAAEMAAIVQMVSGLPEIHQNEINPLKPQQMSLREDKITASLPREELLCNAPQKTQEYFVVPRTVEEE